MRWEDERYVRLYTRDSATWALLPWQSRCLLPLLLRKVDRAGVLEVLEGEEVHALSELVKIPADVVGPGLDGLIKRGTVVIGSGKLRLPSFLAAQEARQSDKLRQQRSRELASIIEGVSHDVTRGHTASQDVTPSCAVPSCAVPSRDVPSRAVPKSAPAKKPREPADPRHAVLVKSLTQGFEAITSSKYPFGGRDAKAVSDLLAMAEQGAIETAWSRALTHKGFPSVRTLPELVTHFAHFVGTRPAERPRDEETVYRNRTIINGVEQ